MNIRIHAGFVPEALTDGEKVLLAFLCTAFHNETIHTELFMNTQDIRIMLGEARLTARARSMLKFHDFYRIAEYNNDVWSFQIRDPKNSSTSGHVHSQLTTLTDPTYICMYYYLLGRMHPWDKTCVDYTGLDDVANCKKPLSWFAKLQMDFRMNREVFLDVDDL